MVPHGRNGKTEKKEICKYPSSGTAACRLLYNQATKLSLSLLLSPSPEVVVAAPRRKLPTNEGEKEPCYPTSSEKALTGHPDPEPRHPGEGAAVDKEDWEESVHLNSVAQHIMPFSLPPSVWIWTVRAVCKLSLAAEKKTAV